MAFENNRKMTMNDIKEVDRQLQTLAQLKREGRINDLDYARMVACVTTPAYMAAKTILRRKEVICDCLKNNRPMTVDEWNSIRKTFKTAEEHQKFIETLKKTFGVDKMRGDKLAEFLHSQPWSGFRSTRYTVPAPYGPPA